MRSGWWVTFFWQDTKEASLEACWIPIIFTLHLFAAVSSTSESPTCTNGWPKGLASLKVNFSDFAVLKKNFHILWLSSAGFADHKIPLESFEEQKWHIVFPKDQFYWTCCISEDKFLFLQSSLVFDRHLFTTWNFHNLSFQGHQLFSNNVLQWWNIWSNSRPCKHFRVGKVYFVLFPRSNSCVFADDNILFFIWHLCGKVVHLNRTLTFSRVCISACLSSEKQTALMVLQLFSDWIIQLTYFLLWWGSHFYRGDCMMVNIGDPLP